MSLCVVCGVRSEVRFSHAQEFARGGDVYRRKLLMLPKRPDPRTPTQKPLLCHTGRIMITAALLSSTRLPEQLLLALDSMLYCAFAIVFAHHAGDNAFGALAAYLALCVAVACPRTCSPVLIL